MLVICKNSFRYFNRPKYYPVAKCKCWVVYDNEAKQRVLGPTHLSACHKYIKEANNAG